MTEKIPNLNEKRPEYIPTPEEVTSLFHELIKKEYTEIRKLEDEQGLYLHEVKIPGDLSDEESEYTYRRKGQYKESKTSETEIQITYYKNGVPFSGTTVARCIKGKWIIL